MIGFSGVCCESKVPQPMEREVIDSGDDASPSDKPHHGITEGLDSGTESGDRMADIYSKEKRSELMSHVRGKGNKQTELRLISLFREHNITGWRRHQDLPGTPDFVFRKERVAVFVDGCFWHGCPKHSTMPANNRVFWRRKLEANVNRDRRVNRLLHAKGWRVVRIWQHSLMRSETVIRRIRTALIKGGRN